MILNGTLLFVLRRVLENDVRMCGYADVRMGGFGRLMVWLFFGG